MLKSISRSSYVGKLPYPKGHERKQLSHLLQRCFSSLHWLRSIERRFPTVGMESPAQQSSMPGPTSPTSIRKKVLLYEGTHSQTDMEIYRNLWNLLLGFHATL